MTKSSKKNNKPTVNNKKRNQPAAAQKSLVVFSGSAPRMVGSTLRQRRPNISMRGDKYVVSHCEYLSDVQADVTANGLLRSYDLNPGLLGTFPWLATMAVKYDLYRVRRMRISYIPNSRTNVQGSVYHYIDYNPNHAPTNDKKELMQNYNASSGSFWQDSHVELDIKKVYMLTQWKYTRDGPTARSLSTTDVGTYNFMIDDSDLNTPAAQGYLELSYEIEFCVEQVPAVITAPQATLVAEIDSGDYMSLQPITAGGVVVNTAECVYSASDASWTSPNSGLFRVTAAFSADTSLTAAEVRFSLIDAQGTELTYTVMPALWVGGVILTAIAGIASGLATSWRLRAIFSGAQQVGIFGGQIMAERMPQVAPQIGHGPVLNTLKRYTALVAKNEVDAKTAERIWKKYNGIPVEREERANMSKATQGVAGASAPVVVVTGSPPPTSQSPSTTVAPPCDQHESSSVIECSCAIPTGK